MIDLLVLYRAQFKTTIASQLQYRGALVIWIIGLTLQPVIYLSVWSTVARSQGGSVDGFNASDFAALRAVFGSANSVFDFQADGVVNSSDYAAFRNNFGLTLLPESRPIRRG